MSPTQEHLLKLLLEIDDICKRNGIEFFLEYGTALGAVRHEGFIPWDNDLDISMTEDNYDKFKEACARELDGVTRTFCDSRTDRSIPHVFGHYVDLTCCRMTQRTAYWKNYCGQTIDVFCHVAMPADREENRKLSNLFYAYDEYVNESFPHYLRKTDDIYQNYLQLQKREKEIGREATLKEAEGKIFGHYREDSEMWMCSSARMNWSVFYPRRYYLNLKQAKFEGHTFNVPSDWFEIMSCYYGDDFHLLPEKLRIHTEMSHTDLPCQAYVDDWTRSLDVDEMLATRKRYKDYGIENGNRLQHFRPEFYRAVGAMVKHHIDQRVEREGIDIEALLEAGDLESVKILKDLLDEYLKKQMHTSVFYWRAYFGCGDLIDCAGMYVLLVTKADVYDIDRLVQVRTFNGLESSEKMQWVQQAAHHVRDMKKYVHYGDLPLAREHAQWALDNLPEMEEVQAWTLFIDLLMAQSAEELESCRTRAVELQERYPKNDLVKKAELDAQFRLGRKEEAMAGYVELYERTRDGFIMLDIRKKREEMGLEPLGQVSR